MSSSNDMQPYWALVKSDLYTFMRQAFTELYQGNDFMDNWHVHAIIHSLENSIQGKMPRLIINLPPRHLKSFITSIVLPAFILGNDPTAKIICISYSDDLARTLARDFRRIIDSSWYRKVFPKVNPLKSTENDFVTDLGGARYAISVGGSLTGKGADFIIIDDPIKPEDAQSERIRNSTNNWYMNTLLSRLDDKKHSVLIVVMQRLHVNDLTGFIEGTSDFHKLSLPSIATQDEHIPIGSERYFRAAGEVLHQERESLETMKEIRRQVGPFIFASQYQQNPDTPEGEIIKLGYLNIIDETYRIAAGGFHWVSIDSASSVSETADYSAICFGYSNKDGHYVLKADRGRWDYETLKQKVLSYSKYDNLYYIVEYTGVGIALYNYLRKAEYTCYNYIPKRDKISRVARALPIFDEGRVFIRKVKGEDSWVQPFINELVTFPNSKFDDQVDSLVQILPWAEKLANPRSSFHSFGNRG